MEQKPSMVLTPTVYPANAENTFTWFSQNNFAIDVSQNGKVLAKREGTSLITVVTANGLSASCLVTCKATIPKLVITDRKNLLSIPEKADVYYERKLYKGWNSICVPFALNLTMFGSEGVKMAVFKDVETIGDKKYLSFDLVEKVEAGMPCMQYDIRVILIKLADRLHNMRTLSSMRADKQMKIAGETDYFYAPLANRLGLYPIKIELENLSFLYRCPKEYSKIDHLLQNDKEQNATRTLSFIEKIGSVLTKKGIDDVRIEAAYRTPFSLRRKMQRETCDFNHLEHRHFIRVVYKNANELGEKETALKIYSALTDAYKEKPGSVLNYIDSPKENGYQSLHDCPFFIFNP